MNVNKCVKIENVTFSFKDFIENTEKYLSIVKPLFRASAFERKLFETEHAHLERLFYNLYYKKGYRTDDIVSSATNTNTTTINSVAIAGADAFNILNALGISVIKHNKVTSNIIFKNTNNKYRIKNIELNNLIDAIKANLNYNYNDLDVSIGVELEFIGKISNEENFCNAMKNTISGHRFYNKGTYNKNPGVSWILGTDSSLHAYKSGFDGYELTSPILKLNRYDMQELLEVINLIQTEFKGFTNNSCGTHIHMSFNCPNHKVVSADLCEFFAKSYRLNEERLFDRVVPKPRKGDNSRWCRSVNEYYYNHGRYYKLNFANCDLGTNNMHLEFRQLAGTLDFGIIAAWIKLAKLFVEVTMSKYNFDQKNNIDANEPTIINLETAMLDNNFNCIDVESLIRMTETAKAIV